MGIKGIYGEIGPGVRVALSKLAVQKFEETRRPLRLAIDTSIWLFQIQAGKGGTNPALRTFYYRLIRLVALNIHPVFVFDGPNKPPFKRNKRTGPNVASIPDFLAKQLLKQFGFPLHLAPGEAEAECALLQREGIVDAVMSEDVDTLMFGSGITLRNWKVEGKSTSKSPTHVTLHDAVKIKRGSSGLDREGMILVALMSGGDYIPEGIPGCGIKTACEAARAGFGRDLCNIAKNDKAGHREWRERLAHELKSNESKMFTRKRNALVIPEDFPRADILGYYTDPAVSSKTALERLRQSLSWDKDLDYPGLREFTKDAFDWVKLGGAKHFIRGLAPALLVRQLRMRGEKDQPGSDDPQVIAVEEARLVKAIFSKRNHPDTDNSTELRIAFTPIELVNLDLEQEEPDEELPEEGSGDEMPLDDAEAEEAGPKKRAPTKYDPTKPNRVWILETFVEVGVPLKFQDYQASLKDPRQFLVAKRANKGVANSKTSGARKAKDSGMAQGAIDRYAKVTKPGVKLSRTLARIQEKETSSSDRDRITPPPTNLPQSGSQMSVVNLLSSSPAKELVPPTRTTRNASLPPLSEEAPANTTKRRRRGPIQRSKTLPEGDTYDRRPSTPPLSPAIEVLDLVDSPRLPSKKSKRINSGLAASPRSKKTQTPKGNQEKAPTSTGRRRERQTTLDTWATPSGRRQADYASAAEPTAPLSPSPLRPVHDRTEVLDLTLSSPSKPLPGHRAETREPAPSRRRQPKANEPRPPLRSINSNASKASSTSTSSKPSSSRRQAPSAERAAAAIEALDLTKSSEPSSAHQQTSGIQRAPSPAEIDTLDLTDLATPPRPSSKTSLLQSNPFPSSPPRPSSHSSPPPVNPFSSSSPPHLSPATSAAVRRSPRNHPPPVSIDAPSSRTSKPRRSKSPSPMAAWKAQQKKKREIVLRKSVAGAFEFVEIDSSPVSSSAQGADKEEEKEKGRRRWRESEVEFLDLVG